nr:uncharacterized mitochondrial protein AtMg00810-like [Tanacetum cinerariifolium]
FEEINGGYVSFGGNPKGGKITGKGKIRTGKLDFDDVYFAKELKFNLFSVSQMCDKKNNVLFIDTEYLTCLFANATLDESNLCHRRLGHINFKTMNKLVKVVTDDYSRFTWVFFLATKDETSPILKTFITGIENQLSLKNMVLVTKPHNKTPYELLHGRIPSIGFMRPFGCPVTILNTLDPLGKLDGKADEGFLVGDSVSGKAFRVFNSRTRIIQETLHMNFLENKPNVVDSGPIWLFDIDTLTKSMNYQPITAGNQSNPSACVQEQFDAEKAGEDNVQQYVLFPLWSSGSKDPYNTDRDATFEVEKPKSKVHVSPSSSAQTKKHDDKTKKEAKGKSLVQLSTGYRNLSTKFKDFSDNSINEVNAVGTLVPTVGQISTNNTNTFSAVGPSNIAVSPTHGKSSNIDPSQYPDDLNMPALEDIIMMMKKISKLDEAMQEELLQFNMQKVWVLVDFSNGKRAIDSPFHLVAYLDSDYAGASLDKKSTTGGCQFLGCRLISWQCKKQIVVATSSTEAEYIPATSCCAQPLLKDLDGEDVDVHTYRSMIGSLMYLTSSRPDIMFAVCACTRFQVTPKALHLHAVKRIFRYLKGKRHLGLWYPKDSPFYLVSYLDSDYAGASLDKKSTTGGCQFLRCRLISWQCKKQTVIATSSTKAEYIPATSCCAQVNDVIRLQALIDRKKVSITEATVREAIRLDDAKSIDCLPNGEIFTELLRMGYEKPSTKLTFYKAFFLAQ